jgi:UDP-N-acetyl-D-mannosaminuronic acid dehydrogenase
VFQGGSDNGPVCENLLPLKRVVAESDILVLCTPHRAYRQLKLGGKPLIDVWSFVEPADDDRCT